MWWRILAGAVALMLWVAIAHARDARDAVCAAQAFEGSRFTVCAFEPESHELRLVWDGPRGHALRTFAALKQRLRLDDARVRFAMNAGMFDDAGAPIGLFIAGGREDRALKNGAGKGNFFLKPNGVFLVDAAGAVRIATTEAFSDEFYGLQDKRTSPVLWAAQSGPMLVIDGKLNAAFQADGASRTVRNGVGVRDASHAFFAISEEAVSFGKFARFFRDALGCRNALYLDGAVSSLWVPAQGRMDAGHFLGPMVVVEDKIPPG